MNVTYQRQWRFWLVANITNHFWAVFESTLNPETRRQGGMHYTSVEMKKDKEKSKLAKTSNTKKHEKKKRLTQSEIIDGWRKVIDEM